MEAATALAEIENEKAIEHLFNNVKACLTNSSYGITFSALTDIYKGEEVFLRWDGNKGVFSQRRKSQRTPSECIRHTTTIFRQPFSFRKGCC